MSVQPSLSGAVADSALRSDFAALRADFPILHQEINGHPLVYLDNAASSQRPQSVIDAMVAHEQHNHANVHRGVHTLSHRSTDAYEGARANVQRFLNAASPAEIIFTRGTTEAINLVAASLGGSILKSGDEILITWMEHHSNIVPWQLIAERTGARVVPAPIKQDGSLDMDAFKARLSSKTRIVAVGHVSNALGTVNPVAEITELAHRHGAVVLIDGAQAMPHMGVDVQALDCDFYAFSGHKMFAPSGIGALYGKAELLNDMPPYQGGGEMILTVSFEKITYNTLPNKFEAGTPNIVGAVGLGAAIDYLNSIDMAALARHEEELLALATEEVSRLPGNRIIGTAAHKAGVLSFVLDAVHAHDLGTIVDQEGVAIRTGHHCAMPVMNFFKVPATARASFALYNNREDVQRLAHALKYALELFS